MLIAVLLGLAVREAADTLELVLIAAFLAVGLNPIVEYAIRRGVKRGWAVLVVALLIIGVVTALAIVIGGVLRNQITTLINDAPKLLDDLRKHKSIAHLDRKYHILSSIEQKLKSPNFAEKYFGGVFNVGLSVLHAAFNVVVVFILTLYFLAALPVVKRTLYSLAPASRRERVGQLGDEILRRVGRYVVGAVLVALLAGTVSLIFMFAVGLGAVRAAAGHTGRAAGSRTARRVDPRRNDRDGCRAGELAADRDRVHRVLPDLRDARGLRDLPAGDAVLGGRA